MSDRKAYMKYLVMFLFFCPHLGYSGDDYMHNPLCGYGKANENPCKGLSTLKIYTGLPRGRAEDLNKMREFNALASKWIEKNKIQIERKDIKIELQNLGGKHYFSTPQDDQLVIGIFAYFENSNIIITLISSARSSNQIFSYLCKANNTRISENSCLYESIDKGMTNLMNGFL